MSTNTPNMDNDNTVLPPKDNDAINNLNVQQCPKKVYVKPSIEVLMLDLEGSFLNQSTSFPDRVTVDDEDETDIYD